MRTQDVESGSTGRLISRWDAVFDCAIEFVRGQAEFKTSGAEDLVFSLVLFNDNSDLVFKQLPLKDDGTSVRSAIRHAQQTHAPCGGTGFAAGFCAVREVAVASSGPVQVIFLSDGRPGDLDASPTPELQRSFRSHGQQFPSAAVYLEKLQKDHGPRLSLHVIGIHQSGFPWLQALSSRYHGTFHRTALSLGEEVTGSAPKPDALTRVNSELDHLAAATPSGDLRSCTKPSLKSEGAKPSVKLEGKQELRSVKLESMSSMRATFNSISVELSSMRSTVSQALRERSGVVLESATCPSKAELFHATRMVLCNKEGQSKFVMASGEKPSDRKVWLASQPFAQGGLRNVYRLEELASGQSDQKPEDSSAEQGTPQHVWRRLLNIFGRGSAVAGDSLAQQKGYTSALVAKESRHIVPYTERLAFHRETSACQARAKELTEEFNAVGQTVGLPSIDFLQPEVYRLADPKAPGGFRYLAVEERLEGAYEKFNSNNGYVLRHPAGETGDQRRRLVLDVPQAFSHFTYEKTDGNEMVVDLQGSGFKYTDPQLHSLSLRYGRADRGQTGFEDFFRTHECNACCKTLGLRSRATA